MTTPKWPAAERVPTDVHLNSPAPGPAVQATGSTTDTAWIADKILTQEAELLKVLQGIRSAEHEAPDINPLPDMSHYPEPTPVDLQIEAQAFAELVQFLKDNPEDDCTFATLDARAFADPSDLITTED